MKKYCVILTLLLPIYLFANDFQSENFQSKNIQPDYIRSEINNKSVVISLKSLSEFFSAFKYDSLQYLSLRGNKHAIPISEEEIILDELYFSLALPHDAKYKLRYNIISKKSISRNFYEIKKSFESKIELEEAGIQRGILIGNLRVQPFSYDTGSKELVIIDEMEIVIDFQNEIGDNHRKVPRSELHFFSNIINKGHIPALINSISPKKQSLAETQSSDWYDPSLNYLRVTTSKDGIAVIDANNIIEKDPLLNGVDVKYLHLIREGAEQAIFIVNDNDPYLSAGDEIFFIGSRAKGDTTWFHNYTDSSVFYLYYDESTEGLRYTDIPKVNAIKELEYVEIEKHLESEKIYFRGDFDLHWDIETIHREGWLWDIMSSDGKKEFNDMFFIDPYDSINFNIRLISYTWNVASIDKHNLAIKINDRLVDEQIIDTGSVNNISLNIPTHYFVAGNNRLSVINKGNYNSNDKVIYPDETGFDYYRFSGKVRPFAEKGNLGFKIDESDNDFNLKIPGFISKEIYIIDKDKKYFSRIDGVKGISIAIGTVSEGSYSSFSVNEHIKDIYKKGLHIGVLKAPGFNEFIVKTFEDINNSVFDYINNIPSGSILTVLYNSNNPIPVNVKGKLKNLGSKSIENSQAGKCWAFCVKTDEITTAIEKYGSSAFARVSGFIEHDSGRSYRMEKSFPSGQEYNIMAFDRSNLEQAWVSKTSKSNLRNQDNKAEAIFITHNKFKNSAEALANYRKSQGVNVYIADVDDVYKEFNYGIKSPHAIKSFLRYTYNNWQKPAPQFVLLVGDANWDSRNKEKNSVNIDYIPSYGWPVSDYWYTRLDTGIDYVHDMLIGRIPANKNQDVINVLNKNIEYDNATDAPWMKRFLSITGGGDESERDGFRESMENMLSSYWINNQIGGDTLKVAKKSNQAVGEAEATEIMEKINRGVFWVNFFGHGSPTVMDVDGWEAEKLNNKGFYSYFTTISCNTAAFAEPSGTSRNESYLTIGDKGFIASGGSSGLGLTLPGLQIVTYMLNLLGDTTAHPATFSEMTHNAKLRMLSFDPQTREFAFQYTYLGDPLTRIRMPAKPDLYIIENEAQITNYRSDKIIIDADSVALIEGIIYNNGFRTTHSTELILYHAYEEYIDTLRVTIDEINIKRDFRFDSLIVFDRPGKHNAKIYLSYRDTIFLAFDKNFEVHKAGLYSLDPFPYWNVNKDNLHFRFIDPRMDSSTDYEFAIIKTIGKDTLETVYESNNSEILETESYIDWIPEVDLSLNDNYYIKARIKNIEDDIYSEWLTIPFYTDDQGITSVRSKINRDFFNGCELKGLKLLNEGTNSYLGFSDIMKGFKVLSVKGNDTAYRYEEIIYDDKIYIASPTNAIVGINMIVVSGKNGDYITTRQYNTWDGDNASRDLVDFIRDSVEQGDWILLGSCGGAWRMFYLTGLKDSTSLGSFYTFKQAMRDYGAELVSQIPEDSAVLEISYAFAGRKGYGETSEIFESIGFSGEPVTVDGDLLIKTQHGEITTPTFGIAKQWRDITLDISGLDELTSSTLSVVGVKDNNSDQLFSYENEFNIDLSFIDPIKYSNLFFRLELERKNEDANPAINSISCNFIPAAELALSHDKSFLTQDTVYRGEPAIMNYTAHNISLRSSAEGNIAVTGLKNQSGKEFIYEDNIPALVYDRDVSMQREIETMMMTETNNVRVQLNTNKEINEFYDFNNAYETLLNLRKDYEKPTVDIYFDGVLIFDSSYVAMAPDIQIRLFDNSFEPVTETPAPIKVRLNSRTQDESNTRDYKLEIVNDERLKAQLSFKPDSIKDMDNIFEVYFQDASGNKDTINYHIFTSLNARINQRDNYPNPFSSSTKFVFDYKASDSEGQAEIHIYDITGKRIRTLSAPLNIGENILEWNGEDDWNRITAKGIYIYSIHIKSNYYAEPKSGKALKQ